MIAKVTKGSGFAGLVRYLETGKDGASPDRVDWVEARRGGPSTAYSGPPPHSGEEF